MYAVASSLKLSPDVKALVCVSGQRGFGIGAAAQ